MIDKARSFYLECLRIFAALYVFIFHIGSETINGNLYLSTPKFEETFHLTYYSAHFFVIVFFVLSGFLIAMSVNKSKLTFKDYLTARLGRLYSVLLPALVITYLFSYILIRFRLVPKVENYDHLLSRFVLNVGFLTQAWNLCATPPLDMPFWSIGYEFVYYLLLAAFVFGKGYKRILLILIITMVIGLKVILLFPCWLIGSLLYYFVKKGFLLSSLPSLLLFLITLLCLFFSFLYPAHFPLMKPVTDNQLFGVNLFFSWNYQADYLFALLIVFNMLGFFGISKHLLQLSLFSKDNKIFAAVGKMGNCTYTLYLFHLPLMVFLASVFPYNRYSFVHQFCLALATLLSVYFIARLTEWKVNEWRRWIRKGIDLVFNNYVVRKFLFTTKPQQS